MKTELEIRSLIDDLEVIVQSQLDVGNRPPDTVTAELMVLRWAIGDQTAPVIELRVATHKAAEAIRRVGKGERRHRAN
jgi:hypothetical protein